jgi:dihydroxyacetone kinase-like protein
LGDKFERCLPIAAFCEFDLRPTSATTRRTVRSNSSLSISLRGSRATPRAWADGFSRTASKTIGEGTFMKMLINSTETVLEESLDGFAAAHTDILLLSAERKFVRRRSLKPGKVALISGGGSGHEPLHAGYVGLGMLDAACPGQVFTSPTPDQMIEAAEAVDTGAGVLFIVKNYEGDVMNFTMAAEMAGREVASVVTDDDVAVENSTYTTGRRGVAGTLIVEKMVGAAAEIGTPLSALKALGDDVNRRTRSMGVALMPCTVPAAGRPNFTLADDEMEMGVGIHGEPGRRRVPLASADAIADELLGAILKDLAPKQGSEVLLLVNGFGATPLIQLYLMVNSAKRILDGAGITVTRFLTGSYVTALDMAGASVTVSVLDGQAKALWDAPVHTAALRWGV